jgi:hypothetical protein
MGPDLHVVRSRAPVLDVPPLVWIDQPGTPRPQIPSGPLWEWPAPPPRCSWRVASLGSWLCRRWRSVVLSQIALAVFAAAILFAITYAITFAVVVGGSAPHPQLRALPVPDEPVWCACIWWPSGPAATLSS